MDRAGARAVKCFCCGSHGPSSGEEIIDQNEFPVCGERRLDIVAQGTGEPFFILEFGLAFAILALGEDIDQRCMDGIGDLSSDHLCGASSHPE